MLYQSLVYLFILYCNVAWGASCKIVLKPLIIAQKKIIRIIAGAHYLSHTNNLFKRLGVLKLSEVNVLESVKFVNQQLNVVDPVIPFNFTHQFHDHYTRGSRDLRPEKPFSNLSKQFIKYRGCLLYNNLPQNVKESTTNSFKIKTKRYLLSLY